MCFNTDLLRQAYHDPMLKLSIMSEEELTHIFGDLDSYIPLHEGESNQIIPTCCTDCCCASSPVTGTSLQFLVLCFNSRLVGKFRGSNKARWNSGADRAHSCEVGEYLTWGQRLQTS